MSFELLGFVSETLLFQCTFRSTVSLLCAWRCPRGWRCSSERLTCWWELGLKYISKTQRMSEGLQSPQRELEEGRR